MNLERELRAKAHQLAGRAKWVFVFKRAIHRAAHSLVYSEESNLSCFASLWIARGQRNCKTHLLSGVIPAEPQPTVRGSLWICSTSTLQHRHFPFHLKLFGRLFVHLQLVKNNNNDLPGSCCSQTLVLLDGITED